MDRVRGPRSEFDRRAGTEPRSGDLLRPDRL